MPLFLLIFILTPLIEIGLFIQLGGWIGLWPTLACVALTAVAGVYLLRWQGISTLLRARTRLDNLELPAEEMMEGMLLAFAGALLVTPGFFTDGVGFLLLVPALRRRILVRWILPRVQTYRVHTYQSRQSGQVFEGEYSRQQEKNRLGP